MALCELTGQRAAMVMRLVQSAKLHGHEPIFNERLRPPCGREVALAVRPLDAKRQAHYRRDYQAILAKGEVLNPRQPPSGRRSRTKQSKAANLLARLRTQATDVWRFMTDADVPFTNNIAEQAVRIPKVKQKVSGCFRSYATTMHKQGANIFHCLTLVIKGQTPQPRLT